MTNTTFKSVDELRNYISNNETVNLEGHMAVVLMYKNFYAHKTVIRIIDTIDTYEEAKSLAKELEKEHSELLKEYKCSISFATTDLFTRGYSYKFAKQS